MRGHPYCTAEGAQQACEKGASKRARKGASKRARKDASRAPERSRERRSEGGRAQSAQRSVRRRGRGTVRGARVSSRWGDRTIIEHEQDGCPWLLRSASQCIRSSVFAASDRGCPTNWMCSVCWRLAASGSCPTLTQQILSKARRTSSSRTSAAALHVLPAPPRPPLLYCSDRLVSLAAP